jgi:hypothetical protein
MTGRFPAANPASASGAPAGRHEPAPRVPDGRAPGAASQVVIQYLAQILNSGLALGSVYGLMAIGFALIFIPAA